MNFIASQSELALDSLQPEVIHRFLISRGQQCCRSYLRTECSSIRGFLSYLQRCGAVALDLSGVVVAPRVYQHDQCPRFLTRPQIDVVLAVIDRKTLVGRRDYAMMLLLTVYGLRGVEVAHLRLEDIDWRNKQLHIRGRKSGNNTTYPLATSVDDAIVEYLRNGRPASSHREVFLSVIAPFRPLVSGAAMASHIVKYLQQAGIVVHRPGTHVFRYSVRNGFSRGCRLKSSAITWGTPTFFDPAVHEDRVRTVTRGRTWRCRGLVVNDGTKSSHVDRSQAEQFQARHLLVWGGPTRADYRFHRAAIRRFLSDLSQTDEESAGRQVILSEKRLVGWLIQEAGGARPGKRGLLLWSGQPLRAGIGFDRIAGNGFDGCVPGSVWESGMAPPWQAHFRLKIRLRR